MVMKLTLSNLGLTVDGSRFRTFSTPLYNGNPGAIVPDPCRLERPYSLLDRKNPHNLQDFGGKANTELLNLYGI